MAYDASGNYSLPGVYNAEAGTTIQPAQHNTPFEDVQAALNSLILRSGVAPMTAPLRISDGTVAAPAVAFNSQSSTGPYKTATGLGISISGTLVAEFKPSLFEFSKTAVFKDGGDIASASALTLGDGNIFTVTGTTAITSIATKGVGTQVWLRFAASLVLTHHATDLIVTGSANITTAAGDWALFEEYATGDWRMVSYHRASGFPLQSALPRNYIDGCTLSNNVSDATNDIDIAAGVCRDSTNTVNITVAAMTKRLDANWAAGTSAGMRNSASSIADGWYHIYAVVKADGTQDIYAYAGTGGSDADSAAYITTMIAALNAETGGSGYLYARRLGTINRSTSIRPFSQFGDEFLWKTAVVDYSTSAVTTTAELIPLTVPIGVKTRALFSGGSFSGSSSIIYTSPDETDQLPSQGGPNSMANASLSTAVFVPHYPLRTDTSSRIRVRGSASISHTVTTRGYLDARGKDA